MDKNYTNLKRSTAPHVYFAKVPLIGALPTWGMVPFCINKLSTCLISNFPGTPEVPIFPDGTKVLDMMFNAGLGEGNVCKFQQQRNNCTQVSVTCIQNTEK